LTSVASRQTHPGVGPPDARRDIDGDPRRYLQVSTQYIAALGQEGVLPIDQQAHHLTLRDAEPDGAQLRGQPLNRHLTLVVVQEDEAAQFRSKVAADAGWQGDDCERCQQDQAQQDRRGAIALRYFQRSNR
jgi:hypothetical protein